MGHQAFDAPGQCKEDGEELGGEAHGAVHEAAVEVHVGVKLALGVKSRSSEQNSSDRNRDPIHLSPGQNSRQTVQHPAAPWRSR